MSEPLTDDLDLHDPPPSRSSRKSNIRFLIAAGVAAVGVSIIAMSSFDDQVYFYTVAEASAKAGQIGDHEFRIKGNVVRASHMLKQGTLDQHLFQLVDHDKVVSVTYKGALPDTFKDEAEVVALGHLEDDGSFVATEVVAKCPSRYDNKAPTAGGAGGHPADIPR